VKLVDEVLHIIIMGRVPPPHLEIRVGYFEDTRRAHV
jgi:hypothetical protein